MYCRCCLNGNHLVKYSRSKNEEAFKCNNKHCDYYQQYISIRHNSFFEITKLDIKTSLIITYYWFINKFKTTVKSDYGISKMTIQKIYNSLRHKTELYFILNPVKLGGRSVICQIDESLFKYKQKYHIDRFSSEYRWVFSIVDTSFNPARYYIECVRDRTCATLIPIIKEVVREKK